MISRSSFLLLLILQIGCRPAQQVSAPVAAVKPTAQSAEPTNETPKRVQTNREFPAKITNQFGMTFCLVEVDTEQWFHVPTYPSQSYYLQQTELRPEQHEAFRTAAFGEGKYENIDWHFNGGHPSEWRQVFHYAEALSKFDTQYDYRLPTLREWTFACKDGYDQDCPKHEKHYQPASPDDEPLNKFGVLGLNNHDVECGDVPGLFFGRHGRPKVRTNEPACRCDWWTKGNPDGDDGLNELITARFVLVLPD